MAEELNIVLEHLRALRDGQEQLDRKAALIDENHNHWASYVWFYDASVLSR